VAEANIDKAVAECKKVKAEHERLMNEKNELVLALQVNYCFRLIHS